MLLTKRGYQINKKLLTTEQLKEIQALLNLRHSNIVTLNQVVLEKEELNIIFEF